MTHLSSKGKCSFPAPVNSSNRVYLEAHSHLPAQLPATGTCLEGTLIPRDVPMSPSTPHPGKWQVGFGMPQQDSCWQSCSHGHHICAVLCYTCMVLNAPRRDIPGNTTGHCACRYEHFTGSGGHAAQPQCLRYVSEMPWETKGCLMSQPRGEAPTGTICCWGSHVLSQELGSMCSLCTCPSHLQGFLPSLFRPCPLCHTT